MDIIVDSSVWIDFFNSYQSKEADELQNLIEHNNINNILICPAIYMEVLRGIKGNALASVTFSPPPAGMGAGCNSWSFTKWPAWRPAAVPGVSPRETPQGQNGTGAVLTRARDRRGARGKRSLP
jgi:hypothetical protein